MDGIFELCAEFLGFSKDAWKGGYVKWEVRDEKLKMRGEEMRDER